MIWWPVFMKICAGAWLNCVVCIERTIAISSAILARCGSSSEISAPDCPYRSNSNGEPSSFGVPLMKANRSPFDELRGNVLAVVLLQRRLGVEQIELRRRAGHEQIDDALGLRRKHRRLRRQRISRIHRISREQLGFSMR